MKSFAIAFAHVLMNQAEEGADLSGSTGTRIRPDLAKYQTAKSASGSSTKICGDEVSVALVGATLDETYSFVSKVSGIAEEDLRAKYGDKNPGQQRMFLGNLIRGAYAGKDKDKAERFKAAFDANLASLRSGIDARMAEAAAAVEAKKAEKQAEKDAKAAEKAAEKAAKKAEAEAKKAEAEAKKAEAKPAVPKAPKAPAQPQ